MRVNGGVKNSRLIEIADFKERQKRPLLKEATSKD